MDFEIYCDESGQELFRARHQAGDRQYVLIGGLWLVAGRRDDIKSQIRRLRRRHNVHGEFKWTRVSPSRESFYVDLVHLFFAEDAMRFRCLVLPADQLDAVQFHDGDNELMFYKFYYQLIHHWILDFNRYRIFLDMKTNRVMQRLTKLRDVLARSNWFSEIVCVQALPSHEVVLLQLVDLLVGAVGYRFHGRDSSAAKLAVVSAIEGRLGHPIAPTSKGVDKFNIFRWHPGGGW